VLAVVLHAAAFAYLALFSRVYAGFTRHDMSTFVHYGNLLRAGRAPYRDFVMEYPPLAAPLFWLPSQFAHGIMQYRTGFAVEMLAFDLGGLGIALHAIQRCGPRGLPCGVMLAQPLWLIWAGPNLVFERFDLAPAVLTLLAVTLLANRRQRLAWMVLGLATAVKLYPVVVAPLFVLLAWRQRTLRQLAADLSVFLAAVALPALIVTRADLLALSTFVQYHADRGLEIETLYASVLLIGHLLGQPLALATGHGAKEVVTPLASLLSSLALPLTALGLAAIYLVAWHNRHATAGTPDFFDRLVRLTAAAILAFMLAGKVLSPQFLLWLYPLLAILVARQATAWALFGLALLLSSWIFPAHWSDLVSLTCGAIAVLIIRNSLLLALAATLVMPLNSATAPSMQVYTEHART
jgi:hypothetical protein